MNYINLPFQKKITSELPRRIQVQLEAKGFDLIAYSFRQKLEELQVDVTKLTEAQSAAINTVMVPARNIITAEVTGIQPDMTVKNINPEYLVFDFSRKYRKMVPVRADISFTCKKQFYAPYKIIIKPDSVEIAGSEEALKAISYVSTKPLQLEQLSRKSIIPLFISKSQDAAFEVNPEKIWAYIPIDELAEEVVEVPVEFNDGDMSGRLLLPDRVRVTFQAPLKMIDRINADEFRICAVIDDEQNGAGKRTRLEFCHTPPGVYKARMDPEFIQILSVD